MIQKTVLGMPRRNLLFFAALALILACLYVLIVVLPRHAAARIEAMIVEAGFGDTHVPPVSLRPSGFSVRGIALDGYDLDRIGSLEADLSWPAFLASGAISQLTLRDIMISRTRDSLHSSARDLAALLLDLPHYRVNISNAVIDLSTSYGDLRLTLDATINANRQQADRDIKARLVAAQYQLGFDSQWQGTLSDQGRLDLAATIEGGRLNFGPLEISRFNGWLAAGLESGSHVLQSQLEAGSARFMDLPLNNLSLVTNHGSGTGDAIARAEIAGLPSTVFSGDYAAAGDSQSFTATLNGPDLGALLRLGDPKARLRGELADAGGFQATLEFQPDRRFVGGPLPFSLSLAPEAGGGVDGTVLFYPDTLEARGSLESSPGMTSALKAYFDIPPANVRGNFIRLDGSFENLIENEPSKAE